MQHTGTNPSWEMLKWICDTMIHEGLAHWQPIDLQAPPIQLPPNYNMGTQVPFLDSTNLRVTQRLWALTAPGARQA